MDDLFEERKKEEKKIFTRYNREERLKNASEKVKQLHSDTFIQKKSLIKSLTATPALRAVFFVIILLVVLNLGFFLLFQDKNIGKINNVKTELQSFIYDNTPLANIKLYKNEDYKGEPELVKVEIAFFDKDENKISSNILTGFYTGSELKFSSRDESGKAKIVIAIISMKEKLLQLSKKIDE